MVKNIKKLKLALLYGGMSAEHEISLISAASIFYALDKKKYDITLIAIDKLGNYFINPAEELPESPARSLPVCDKYSKSVELTPSLFSNIDLIFPILHGPLYEDGCLQGFFELGQCPYVGTGVLGSALSMDKEIAKRLVSLEGITIAPYKVLYAVDSPAKKKQVIYDCAKELGFPLFVKPATLGSSVGTDKVFDLEQLQTALSDAFRYDTKVLVEKAIEGQEIELAVLGSRNQLKVSGAGEICVLDKQSFYSYQAKYIDKDATRLQIPAQISKEEEAQLQTKAMRIFEQLECEGLARVDFFVERDTRNIVFNEINTLPGFTEISMFPKLWMASGLTYSALLDELVSLALDRFQLKRQLVRDSQ